MKIVHFITALALSGIAFDLIQNEHVMGRAGNRGWLILGLVAANVFFGSKLEDSLLGLWIRRKSLEQKAKIEELTRSRSNKEPSSGSSQE